MTDDVDFDYGTAIGKPLDEWIIDNDSLFEVMAVSIENFLRSSGPPDEPDIGGRISQRRSSFRDNKTGSSSTTKTSTHSDPEYNVSNNNSSVNESVERNWEYYENLRRCYDPADPIFISQAIPETTRCRSEESTPPIRTMDVLERKISVWT